MTLRGNRVEVLQGVNLNMLGVRNPDLYGSETLTELELQIRRWAQGLGLEAAFFQTNHEGQYVERIHRLREGADAAIVNPGAWSHYSYAISDALEVVTDIPIVEVHLSDTNNREQWRKTSVVSGLVTETIVGKGADGYRLALETLAAKLDG